MTANGYDFIEANVRGQPRPERIVSETRLSLLMEVPRKCLQVWPCQVVCRRPRRVPLPLAWVAPPVGAGGSKLVCPRLVCNTERLTLLFVSHPPRWLRRSRLGVEPKLGPTRDRWTSLARELD